MRKWTKAAGLIFLAVASVYSEGALREAVAAGASSGHVASASGSKAAKAPEVNVLEDAKDVSAPATRPATQPATQPVAAAPAAAAQTVAVKDLGTVEVHVNDASLVEVLKMLSMQSQRNIIASKDVRGTVTANLYDVTVKEALDAILKANGYDYREKGNFIFVYTQKELADMEKAALVKKTEMFRLYYTPAVNAANMIKPVLSTDAIVSFTTPAKSGIDVDGKDVGGNDHATEDLIVVTDYPERLDQARVILKEVDRRPQQILVEAVILRATLQENNDLGVDFTVLGGVDFNTLSGIGTSTVAGTTGTSTSTSTGTGSQQLLGGQIIDNPNAGRINDSGAVGIQAGGNGLKLGVVKNNVGMFLSALEGVTDTVVMANPKVLVLNKQKGEVQVGSQQGYRTAVTTETLTADDVKFLDTGTRLTFRPYIGDNGYIRLEIHPEDSSGSVNAQGLPNKFVTQVTSNVMVRDGHTIVIGGLFRDSTDRTRSQVPGLGSLPIIGPAFRHQTDNTDREEVIILLTPHIVKDESAYAAAGEETLKDAERLRVGMRRGLMPFGRERLAESWYEKAQEELHKEKPDRGRALWYLNAAINLNPLFSEAVELRAKVTGRELAATDNAASRYFVQRMIMAEKGKEIHYPSDTPPATVPSLQDRSVRSGIPAMPMAAAPASRPAAIAAAAATPATMPAAAVPAPKMAPVTAPASRPTMPQVTETPLEWED